MAIKFEYSTVVFDTTSFFVGSSLDHDAFNQKLNEYGAQGWELVNAVTLDRMRGSTYEVIAIFRRSISM